MKKTPTLFERDWAGDRSRVINKPNPACQWVFDGEGCATRKYDGTCCLWHDGKLWKRREIKAGQPEPDGFVLADRDDETGKVIGWVPVGDGPEDRWHREALEADRALMSEGFTYELLGPKVQGGVEHDFPTHTLFAHRHMGTFSDEPPRTFDGLRDWLSGRDIEGIVFDRGNGVRAKIKLKDFGLKRVRRLE